jgi:hypothetical protein
MQFPTPDDPQRAPVWDNYVTAQAAAAALRLIPTYANALGVKVAGTHVHLVVQRPSGAPDKDDDLDDIVDELSDLLGPDVTVSLAPETRAEPTLRPDDGVRWFWAARAD